MRGKYSDAFNHLYESSDSLLTTHSYRISVLEESLSSMNEKANNLSTELQRRGHVVEALTVENAAMANKIELLSRSKNYEKEISEAQLIQLNDL